MKRHHVTLKQGRNRLYQQLTDAVFGLSDWQASGRKDEFIDKYVEQNAQLLKRKKNEALESYSGQYYSISSGYCSYFNDYMDWK